MARAQKERYKKNETQNEQQGKSRKFALGEEVTGKEVIEEEPDEANLLELLWRASDDFAVPALPTEGQPFMAVVLGNNCNMLLGPKVL